MEDATTSVQGESEEHLWTPQITQLLMDWRNRAYSCQTAYFLVSEKCRRWNYWLGIPVVVLSTLVGTTIFSSGLESAGRLRYLFGGISILAGTLASLQTFLRFAESANKNAVAGEWYSSIRREIEGTLALPPSLRGNPKAVLDAIRVQMNEAGQKTPELPTSLWRRVANAYEVDEPFIPADVEEPPAIVPSDTAGESIQAKAAISAQID